MKMRCPGCGRDLVGPVEEHLGCCRPCCGMTREEYAEALADLARTAARLGLGLARLAGHGGWAPGVDR